MSIEAMKQAMDALEGWAGHGKWIYPESALEQAKKNTEEALPVLRAAIEQAEEPRYKLSCGCPSQYGGIPAEWATTDREGNPAIAYGVICEKHWHEYDAQHPKVWQEPAAIVVDAYDTPGLQWFCQHPPKRGDRLYTAPQPTAQREWQELTDEQIHSACLSYRHDFGLLSVAQQDYIRFQATEWAAALAKARSE